MEWLCFVGFFWAIFMGLGYYVSSQKGRDAAEGVILGLLFGPFGVLIAALMPSSRAAANSDISVGSTPSKTAITDEERQEVVDRHVEKERLRTIADRQAFVERQRERKEAAMKRRIEKREAYLARGITPGPLAPIESFSLHALDWYRGLGDLGQMLVWAVCLAIPAGCLAVVLFRR